MRRLDRFDGVTVHRALKVKYTDYEDNDMTSNFLCETPLEIDVRDKKVLDSLQIGNYAEALKAIIEQSPTRITIG